jgi:hypothetical protein
MSVVLLNILPGTGRGTAQRWRGRSKPMSVAGRSVHSQPDPSVTPPARHLPVPGRNDAWQGCGVTVFKFLAVLSLPLMLPSVGRAQETTGSRIGAKRASIENNTKSGADARKTMDEYARCVVQTHPTRVAKFLAMVPAGREYERMSDLVTPDTCLSSGEMVIPNLVLRTALFDRFYHSQFKSFPATDAQGLPTLNYALGAEVSGYAQTQAAALQFADCVIRADPHLSHELLSTEIDTAPETVAFKKVIPLLGPCLTSGAKFEISKSILRGFIAESLYKIRTAAAETRSAGGQK